MLNALEETLKQTIQECDNLSVNMKTQLLMKEIAESLHQEDIQFLQSIAPSPYVPNAKSYIALLAERILECDAKKSMPLAFGEFSGLHQLEEADVFSGFVTGVTCALHRGPKIMTLNIREPYRTHLISGRKTIEGRLHRKEFADMLVGDIFVVAGEGRVALEITKKCIYSDFHEMLVDIGEANLGSVLPEAAQSIIEAENIYNEIYPLDKRQGNKVVAFHVTLDCVLEEVNWKDELVIDIVRIRWLLNVLGDRGIGAMLGLRHTQGSRTDILPPHLAALIRPFISKHAPESKLSVGARALAKHCHRSSNGWWLGDNTELKGSEEDKNKQALAVLHRVIENIEWVNMHELPHAIPVLEMRTPEGYGVRWALIDPSNETSAAEALPTKTITDLVPSFRGFLEPQQENGHENRWRH